MLKIVIFPQTKPFTHTYAHQHLLSTHTPPLTNANTTSPLLTLTPSPLTPSQICMHTNCVFEVLSTHQVTRLQQQMSGTSSPGVDDYNIPPPPLRLKGQMMVQRNLKSIIFLCSPTYATTLVTLMVDLSSSLHFPPPLLSLHLSPLSLLLFLPSLLPLFPSFPPPSSPPHFSSMDSPEDLYNSGIFINDLSMHDSSRDFILAGSQQNPELNLALSQVSVGHHDNCGGGQEV